jgi:hypothetical protein
MRALNFSKHEQHESYLEAKSRLAVVRILRHLFLDRPAQPGFGM